MSNDIAILNSNLITNTVLFGQPHFLHLVTWRGWHPICEPGKHCSDSKGHSKLMRQSICLQILFVRMGGGSYDVAVCNKLGCYC